MGNISAGVRYHVEPVSIRQGGKGGPVAERKSLGIAVINIHPPTVLFGLFVAYGLSGYVVYGWRRAKGQQASVISTSTDEPDERGLHE